jgi:hypothetical protein
MDPTHIVNIYRRRRGASDGYRFLLHEVAPTPLQALGQARRVVDSLRLEFPEYEFIIVKASRRGSETRSAPRQGPCASGG